MQCIPGLSIDTELNQMTLKWFLRAIDFDFVFNLYYAPKPAEKRLKITLEGKLNYNKYIPFLITLKDKICGHERLLFSQKTYNIKYKT